jgi:hypothetical protein
MPVSINNTQIVFNDGTTQSTSAAATVNTTNVLSATAGASAGAVGTYGLLYFASNEQTLTNNTNYSGSLLRNGHITAWQSGYPLYGTSPNVTQAGTWKYLGSNAGAGNTVGGLFLRVS